jgi:hypothetical protein
VFRTDEYAPEVVLSYGYWRRRFAEDPSVVGRSIRIGNQPATIVGVMPQDLVFPYPGMLGPSGFTRVTSVDMWASMAFAGPMAADQRTTAANGEVVRNVRFLGAIGRRKAGVSLEQVRADLASVARGLEAEHPASNAGWGVIVTPARDQTVGKIRPALLLLFGGVGLVLMMATVNVANLMLSRSLERRSEYATRVALGAGRARMLRQSLVESLFLSAAGGTLGLAAALVGIRMVTRFRTLRPSAPRGHRPGLAHGGRHAPDGRRCRRADRDVSSVECRGCRPAARAQGAGARHDGEPAPAAVPLGSDDRAGGARMRADRWGGAAPSQLRLRDEPRCRVPVRWPAHLADESARSADDPDARRLFYVDFFDRLQRLPGVVSAGGTTRLPLGSTSVSTTIEIQGRPSTDATRPEVEFRRALHHYFETMQIPVTQGGASMNQMAPMRRRSWS